MNDATKKPNTALFFGFLAWVPAAIYWLLPRDTFGAPAQFNLTPMLAICLLFGLGMIFALCGAFLCCRDTSRSSPAQISGAAVLSGTYLLFIAVSIVRILH